MKTNTQSGNALIFVLIGIVLFAGLAFTVARGFRSESTTNMSRREADLAASEITSYAQDIEHVVNNLRVRGCSEGEISFENPTVSGYNFSTRDECKVFSPVGGHLDYKIPPTDWLDPKMSARSNFGEWMFTNTSCIDGVGTGASSCQTNAAERAKVYELFAVLRYLKKDICETINNRVYKSKTIQQEANTIFGENEKYTGSYANLPGRRIGSAQAREINCMQGNNAPGDEPVGSYHFYNVLIAR